MNENPKIRKSEKAEKGKTLKRDRRPEKSTFRKSAIYKPEIQKRRKWGQNRNAYCIYFLRFRHGPISRSIQWRSPMSLDRETKEAKMRQSLLECSKRKSRAQHQELAGMFQEKAKSIAARVCWRYKSVASRAFSQFQGQAKRLASRVRFQEKVNSSASKAHWD